MSNLLLFTILILASFPTIQADDRKIISQEGINALLIGKHRLSIVVDDQVTGGCLPYPNKLKDKAELLLRKHGFSIKTEGIYSEVLINALGGTVGSNYCFTYISVSLRIYMYVLIPYATNEPSGNRILIPHDYLIGSVMLYADKKTMQSRIEKIVKEFADQLYLDISRAEDRIFTNYPAIKQEYLRLKHLSD
jgi:hypothetical protein